MGQIRLNSAATQLQCRRRANVTLRATAHLWAELISATLLEPTDGPSCLMGKAPKRGLSQTPSLTLAATG